MEQILFIRENVISFYKRFEGYILFILKLIAGLIVFGIINDIGFAREELEKFVLPPLKFPYTFLLSVLFAITSHVLGYMLIIVAICIQISHSIEILILTLAFMLCVMVFYIRIAPNKSILILLTIMAFYFKIPYTVPIFAGLYMGITSIIPVSIGVFIWSFMPSVLTLLNTTETAGLDIMEMPSTFSEVYVQMMQLFSNNTDWIFIAFVFSMVIIAVYAISRLSIDYSKDLAIVLGAVLNIVSFITIMLIARIDVSLLFMFLSSILSALIIKIIQFFDIVLDYSKAESVEFEDEKNYYYVRVIPKIIVSKKKKVVKRVRDSN